MKDIVVLKGDREGLFLVVNPERPFSDILSDLEEKLDTSSEFFIRTPTPPLVRYKGERFLTSGEGAQLCALLDRYGIIYNSDFPKFGSAAKPDDLSPEESGKTYFYAGGPDYPKNGEAAAKKNEEKNEIETENQIEKDQPPTNWEKEETATGESAQKAAKGGRAESAQSEAAAFLVSPVFEMETARELEAGQAPLPPPAGNEPLREVSEFSDLAPPWQEDSLDPGAAAEFWLQPDQGVWAELPERAAENDEDIYEKETGAAFALDKETAKDGENPAADAREEIAPEEINTDPVADEDRRVQVDAAEGDMMSGNDLLAGIAAKQTEKTDTDTAAGAKTAGSGKAAEREPVGNIILSPRQHISEVNYERATRSVLTIYRTVRGGQEVRYNGTIIIFGDINPTARIFAENDIIVAGVTRGILYAGCRGDRSASIAAGSFSGGQIRIADLIVRAPAEPSGAVGFGVARICDNQIEIQTIRR